MKDCRCILSGFANTTNYCPVHKKLPVQNKELDSGRFQVNLGQSEPHDHQGNDTTMTRQNKPKIETVENRFNNLEAYYQGGLGLTGWSEPIQLRPEEKGVILHFIASEISLAVKKRDEELIKLLIEDEGVKVSDVVIWQLIHEKLASSGSKLVHIKQLIRMDRESLKQKLLIQSKR